MKTLINIVFLLTTLSIFAQPTGYLGQRLNGTNMTNQSFVYNSPGITPTTSRLVQEYRDSTYARWLYNTIRFDVLGSSTPIYLKTDAMGNLQKAPITDIFNPASYYTRAQSDVRYLQSFTEADPIFVADSSKFARKTWVLFQLTGYFTKAQSDSRYLQSFVEQDPIFTASSAFGITGTNISNWNIAFGWGNHAGLYPLLSGSYTNPSWIASLPFSKITGVPAFLTTETDPTVPLYSKSLTAFSIIKTSTDALYEPLFTKNTAFNKNFGTALGTVVEGNDVRVLNGQTAFGWGDHSLAGYATAANTMTFTNKSGNISQWTNNVGYLTSINSAQVTAALGYTPVNPNGTNLQYIAGDGSKITFPTIPTNTNQLVNGAGFINQVYNPTQGVGIKITGSYPNQVIAVDTSVSSAGNNAVMYVGKANASINALQNGVNSKEPIISAGTIGQYWRGDKTWQTLNTSVVPEGTNLYFNNTRARNAISITSTGTGSASYDAATGVINIPTPSTTAPGANSTAGYGTGSTYTLTATSAKVDFGTTDPTITLPSAGTYLIMSNVTIEYVGLTTLSLSQCNFKVRRTNNTPTDLPNANTNFTVPILTLTTQTAGDADLQSVIYTTTNSNDILEIWGNRGTSVSVGSVQTSQASIIAIRLY